jgi:hypothetical protein
MIFVVLIFISDSSGEERSALDWALSLLWTEAPAADIDMEVRIECSGTFQS